jgi:signal transduction histidine kinase
VPTVRLTYVADTLAIEVEDNGRGADATVRAGNGLGGMRERVEALGGRFAAAPLAGRGFRVRARLPLGAAP